MHLPKAAISQSLPMVLIVAVTNEQWNNGTRPMNFLRLGIHGLSDRTGVSLRCLYRCSIRLKCHHWANGTEGTK